MSDKTDDIPEHLRSYRNFCNDKITAFADSPSELPQATLYHYTTFEGLKGILKKRQLWLTEYRHLNDTSEVRYAFEQICKLIVQYYSSSTHHQFWELFRQNFDEIVLGNCNYYVTSFCKESNYLPAWRFYADNGAGFAIGFQKEFFTPTKNEPLPNSHPTQSINIHYEIKDGFEACIQTLISRTEKEVSKSPNDYIMIMKILASNILPILSKLKHPAYKEEQEHRICIPELLNSLPSDKKFFRHNLREKSPFVNSIPSTIVGFEHEDIIEIWVGPRCHFEHAKQEVIRLLAEYGYTNFDLNNIKQSDIPYRNI